ncbi:MAG: pyruvate formate lyase family protein [Eubacteriales bacterium]
MDNKEKSALLLEETLELLRNKPVNSTLVERWRLIDRAGQLYRHLPQPLHLGYGLGYVVENASLPIKPYDLLLGRFDDHVPTPEEEEWLSEFAGRLEKEPSIMTDGGHITFDWDFLLRNGISGYIKKAEERLTRALADGSHPKTLDFLQAMILTYKAYRRYMFRYGQAACEAGQGELADVCAAIADNPPSTFRQGMQLVLFILYVFYIYGGAAGNTLTLGRLDELLLPLYENDIQNGTLTREDAGYIIDDLNCKCNLILGRGEHQMSGGSANDTGWFRNPVYDAPIYIILGGYSNVRDHRQNPLTLLFAERIIPRFENPVYVYRRTKDRPDGVWGVICDRLRRNASVLIYNDETVIPSMKNAGIDHPDAVDYTIHACNWPDVPAKYSMVDSVGGPIPKMIMSALYAEKDGVRVDYPTMDALYTAVGEVFRSMIKPCFELYRERFRSGRPNPLPETLSCTDCFTQGVIESATNRHSGAVKYPAIYVMLRNIGTAADMLSALDTVVYRNRDCTLDELRDALDRDFAGDEVLLRKCRKAPKYGTDDDFADGHAAKMMSLLQQIVDEEARDANGELDVIALNLTITDMWHIGEGMSMAATPDGRRAHAPLSENLSPTRGVADSVTALLNSVSKLPFDRLCSGALNLRIGSSLVDGQAGLERLKTILDIYFERGGMQIQLSVADKDKLRDAQVNPESYKDLMVRITGYSAVFVDMCKSAQDEIIMRD